MDQAANMGRKMQKGDFDFNDFMAQANSVRKLGGMGGMMKMIPGMAGKITEEQLFEAEKRMKVQEKIVNAMSEEERANPDLIVQFGGKKELVQLALTRRSAVAEKSGLSLKEIDQFVMEFQNMRKMMKQNMKGMDMDAMEQNPDQPMETERGKEKKSKKIKPTRGGGGGFGGK
jgi:signal recognition particle subunit SRP54